MDLTSRVEPMLCLSWDTERPYCRGKRRSPDFVFLQNEWYLEMKLESSQNSTPVNYRCKIWMRPRPCASPIDYTLHVDCQIRTRFDKEKLFCQSGPQRHNNAQSVLIFDREIDDEDVRRPSAIGEEWTVFCMFKDTDTCEPLSLQVGNKTVNLSVSSKDSSITTVDECVQVSQEVPRDMEALSSDISSLLYEEILPDFKLNCGDRSFPVHRSVLAARSEVFRAMLQNQMQESETGSADIKDLEAPVLESLLKFFYSGQLEDLSEDTAASLYEVADKYAVPSLRKACSYWMERNLSEENCISYLSIADSHSDPDLTAGIVSFIVKHPGMFKDPDWLIFSEQHPVLANKVFQAYVSSVIP